MWPSRGLMFVSHGWHCVRQAASCQAKYLSSVSLSPVIFVACRCKCGAIVRRGMARIAATGTWHGCHDTSPHATTVACRCKCGTVALVIVLLAFWALPVSRTTGNQRLHVSSRTEFIRRADGQNEDGTDGHADSGASWHRRGSDWTAKVLAVVHARVTGPQREKQKT
jgi:hypothetical protein